MHNMEYYTTRLKCSVDDKRACIKIAEKLYHLGQLARKSGLLVLEAAVENETDLFLQKSVMMIVDATYPEKIHRVLETYIAAGDYWGKNFLEKVLVLDGVLMIQQGENPLFIVQALGAWFGLEFMPIYEEEMQAIMPQHTPPPTLNHRKNPSLHSTPFDEFCNADDRSMQRLIRELDAQTMGAALYNANDSTLQRFLNNMSKRKQEEVIQEMNGFQNIRESSCKGAQMLIEDCAKALEDCGEIVFVKAKDTLK